jgi:multidrug efflux pump subunit AcrA (membrane-fusion protein)
MDTFGNKRSQIKQQLKASKTLKALKTHVGETRNVTDATVLSVKKSLLKSGENVNTGDRLLLMVNCLTDINNLKRPMICFTAAPFPTALLG